MLSIFLSGIISFQFYISNKSTVKSGVYIEIINLLSLHQIVIHTIIKQMTYKEGMKFQKTFVAMRLTR